jgi:lysozyme family protein
LNVLNYRQGIYRDIKADGKIGRNTLFALKKYLAKRGKAGEEVLVGMLNALQGARYIELAERREKDEAFIYGWFKNRIIIPIKNFFKKEHR